MASETPCLSNFMKIIGAVSEIHIYNIRITYLFKGIKYNLLFQLVLTK